MSSATALDIRELRPEDEPAVLDLLTASMAGGPTGRRTPEFFAWKHRRGPFGVSPGLVATDGERVVGVRLFMRWQLRAGGRTLAAVRAVDTATHPDYQRRGIFRSLTLELLDRMDAEGVALVFNTPNANSRPGYLRMGWQQVGTLPVRISPVRPLRFLRGARAAGRATAAGPADGVRPAAPTGSRARSVLPPAAQALAAAAEVSALLARRAEPTGLHTPLTLDYLRWRYGEAPGLDYRAVEVRRGEQLIGLGLGRIRRRAGLHELTLGEVLVASGDRNAARLVLRAARRAGVDHVAIHTPPGSETDTVALRSGYATTPLGGIGLVVNPRPGCSEAVLAPSSWRLSLGDLEVF